MRLKPGLNRCQVFVGLATALGTSAFELFIGSAIAPALAQTADIPLYERPSYNNTCRSSGTGAITVYSTASQTQVVRQLQPYTRITLTGVLGQGVAQIQQPALGWVRTNTLLSSCNAVPDPGPGPGVPVGACYQVLPAEIQVRTAPYGGYLATVFTNERVYATIPPQRQTTPDGQVWLRAYYKGTVNLGWLAETGTNGLGLNLGRCN